MKRGQMSEEERLIRFNKGIIMEFLTAIQVRVGNFNLNKFTKEKGLEGLHDLQKNLVDVIATIDNLNK